MADLMNKLKYGLVGLGRMGAEPSKRLKHYMVGINDWIPITHAEVAQKMTSHLEFVAICDVNDDKLKKYKEIYGVPNTYNMYEKMIDECSLDFISIATRSDVRYEIMKYAIQKGIKAIFAEKPFTQTLKSCKDILQEAKKNNVRIALGTSRRGMMIYRKAKSLVESGLYGKLKHISIEYGINTLMWNHPHSADLIVFYAGNTSIKSIQASCLLDNAKNDIVDGDLLVKFAQIEFDNDVTASITPATGCNVRLFLSDAIITITGDGFSIDVDKKEKNPYYFHEKERIFLEESNISGTEYIFLELVNSLRNNSDFNIFTYEDILKSNEIIFGIVESALRNSCNICLREINENRIVTGKFNALSA